MTEPFADDRDKPGADWTRPPEPKIHWAARKGDLAVLEQLLKEGADINERADLEHDNGPHLNGLTPLMVAARSIDGATVETLRWLVEHGADVRATSAGGNTAAWYAAGHGGRWDFHKKAVTADHTERLAYLLDLGLDPNECNFIGRSLLTEACEAGDPRRVRLLLDRGIDVVITTRRSKHRAPVSQFHSMLDGIFGGGAELPRGDADSYEIPLFCAARSGSRESVQLILDAGADPNTRDSSGETPLMVAGSAAVVRTLLDHGAELNARNSWGKDAFDAVLEDSCGSGACGPGRFEVARALVDAGVDIERIDRFGKSHLASAAFGHHDEAVEFLLKLGAQADAIDAEGGTPLHSICWQGESDEETNAACVRIINLLVDAGVALEAEDKYGATAMHEAASGDWGNATAIRTLLSLGANPDPIDRAGNTPLMLAAGNGEVECIELLVRAGANPLHSNNDGNSPVDAAAGHLESWRGICARGPDETVTEAMQAIQKGISEDMGIPFDEESNHPSFTIDQAEMYRSALAKAEQAFAALQAAAKLRSE